MLVNHTENASDQSKLEGHFKGKVVITLEHNHKTSVFT
jgi:hypothetical protein